jgi:hypothetical protein
MNRSLRVPACRRIRGVLVDAALHQRAGERHGVLEVTRSADAFRHDGPRQKGGTHARTFHVA